MIPAACATIPLLLGAQPAEPLADELAALQDRLLSGEMSPAEREGLEDRALDVRRRLILATTGDDDRAPTWMIDQAAALLARRSRDGSDTSALTGFLSPTSREAVRSDAVESATLLSRAAAMTDRLLARPPADLLTTRRTVLADEKAVRIPFFQVRALALTALFREGADRVAAASLAIAAGDSIRLGDPQADAIRRTNLALALLVRGEPGDAARAQSLAHAILSATGDRGRDAPTLDLWAGARAEAWFAWVLASGRAEGPNAAGRAVDALRKALPGEPFTTGGRADPLLILLATDTMARTLIEAGEGRNLQLTREACETLLAIVEREDLGLDRPARWALISERLTALIPGEAPLTQLPAAVAVGRAVVAARSPEGRDEAVRLLTQAAAREDAGPWREEALWELSVLLTASEAPLDRLRAVRSLSALARDFPASPRADRAIAAALAYGRDLAADEQPGVSAEARIAYADALALATAGPFDLPDREFWWCERARTVLETRMPPPTDADRAQVRSLLERIAPGSDRAAEATSLYLADADRDIALARDRFAAAMRRGDERGAATIAVDELLPAAQRALAWAQRHASPGIESRRLDVAEAIVEAGRPGALAIYDDLARRAPDLGEARLLLGRARALRLERREEEAFAILRDLTNSLELAEPRPEAFWHAWTLLLESLAAREDDRSPVVRTHLERLRSIDRSLGGRPWSDRLLRVERGLR